MYFLSTESVNLYFHRCCFSLLFSYGLTTSLLGTRIRYLNILLRNNLFLTHGKHCHSLYIPRYHNCHNHILIMSLSGQCLQLSTAKGSVLQCTKKVAVKNIFTLFKHKCMYYFTSSLFFIVVFSFIFPLPISKLGGYFFSHYSSKNLCNALIIICSFPHFNIRTLTAGFKDYQL